MKKKNWNINKKTLNDFDEYETKDKTAFDLILDLFISLLNLPSSIKYKQVVNALKTDAFKTEAERHFMDLLPRLLVSEIQSDRDKLINLIGLIRRSAYLNKWEDDKQGKKSYKTYCTTFVDFLEKFIDSQSKNKRAILEKIRKYNLAMLTQEEEKYLSDAIDSHHVFLHDKLKKKFKRRLRSQGRTSGDKVWLPLNFIAKIYKYKNDSGFNEWLDKLVDEIIIHYMDEEDNQIKSVYFKTDVFLDFEINEDGKYDVYVIWTHLQKPQRHRVYTPTGKGNKKEPMTVTDISGIDIDHVKSIDLTLRDLDEKNLIPSLKAISEAYKHQDEGSDTDKPSTELKDYSVKALSGTIDICAVTEELDLIRKDGVLRLMDSAYNEQKSNGKTFDPIRKYGDTYLGIIGDAIYEDNGRTEVITIYQDLAENGVTRARIRNKMPKARKVNISKKLVEKCFL